MNKSNSKYVTLAFLAIAVVVAVTLSELISALAGAFAFMAKLSSYDIFKHGFPFLIAVVLFLSLQLNKKVHVWAEEVIVEIKKVVWPSIKDTRGMTIVVIVMVFISSIIISVFDLLSGFALNQLIK